MKRYFQVKNNTIRYKSSKHLTYEKKLINESLSHSEGIQEHTRIMGAHSAITTPMLFLAVKSDNN